MDLRWLDDLRVLASEGGFARAARRRMITQPAFSKRIQSLETWVGAALVNRETHPVKLTEAGEAFLANTSNVVEILESARAGAQALVSAADDQVVFTAASSLSQRFVPRWLTGLRARYPGFRMRIPAFIDYRESFEALVQRKVNFFITFQMEGQEPRMWHRDLIWKDIGRSELVPVSRPNRVGGPLFMFDCRARYPLPHLCRARSSYIGAGLQRYLDRWRLPIEDVFELSSSIAIKHMAMEGHGLAWVPHENIADELLEGRLVPVDPVRWRVPMNIRLYRLDRPMGAAAEKVWECAEMIGDPRIRAT